MTVRYGALLALPLFATACAPEGQIKRQPGSWSQKIEIVKLEGKGATPDTKVQMQRMFDAMSGMSICLTPAAAAKEDLGKNMEQMGSHGQNCTFGKRDVTGSTIGFDAVCKQANGGTMKLTANGINAPTSQDVTMKMEGFSTTGASEGVMEMHVSAKRNGDCKAGDITPPEAPATPAAAAKP